MSRLWSSKTGANGLLALRIGGAAALAAGVARSLNLPHPVYALIAAVLVTDANPGTTRRLALTRLVGTCAGATAGGLLSLIGGPPLVMVALGVSGVYALAAALKQAEAGKLASYVAGVVLLEHADQPATYAFERVAETGLGLAAALLFARLTALVVRRRSP